MSASYAYGDTDDLVFLLTLDFAGQKWRLSTRPVGVTDEDGDTWQYVGGLDDVDISDEVELLADTPAVRSVPVRFYWPDAEGVAPLVALGHDLGSATGELSVIRDGDAYEERLVLLSGNLDEPVYGEPEEVVAASLEENPWDDVGTLLDDRAVVKEGVTWDDSVEDAEGAYYPFVFGKPGPYTLADGTAKTATGSEALLVDNTGGTRYILVAGHRTEAGATGASLGIYNASYKETIDLTASHVQDNLGRTVTVVDATTELSSVIDDDGDGVADPWKGTDSYYCVWSGAGGAYRVDGEGPVEGAGDLVAYVLNRTSLRLDRGAIAAARPYLNRILVSGYADVQGAPYDYLRDKVLPILPVSMTAGPGGVYPAVLRYDATPDMAVAELVEGPEYGLIRADGPAYEGRADVVNEITLSYALSARLGRPMRSRTITGDPARVGEADVLTSLHARQSYLRYGRRAKSLQADIVYDTASADIVLLSQVMMRGFARRLVTFSADLKWGWLRKGDIVLVSAERVSLARQLGMVRAMRWGLTGLSLDVVLLEDPARDARVVL